MERKNILIFILLSLAAGMTYFVPLLKFTFYDQMMAALVLDDVRINVLSSIYAFVNIFMYLLSGVLGERFSPRWLLALTMFGMGFLTLCYSFVRGYTALILIHCLYSFFVAGTFWCPYVKVLRSLGDESIQGRLFGMSEAVRGLGQAAVGFAALAVIGAAADVAQGFSVMLRMSAAVYVVLGVLLLRCLPKESICTPKEKKQNVPLWGLLKNKGVWLVTWIVMCGLCLWILANTYLTTYTVRVLGVSESAASVLGILRSYAIVFLAGFGGGWMLDRFPYKGKSMGLLFGFSAAVLFFLCGTAVPMAISLGLTMVLTVFVNMIKTTYFSLLGQAGIPRSATASATGIISFIGFIPESFIALVGAARLNAANTAAEVSSAFREIFLLMIAFALCGMIGSWLLWKRTIKIKKYSEGI